MNFSERARLPDPAPMAPETGRNTTRDMVLRSHFFMGEDLTGAMPPEEIAALFPDALGPNTAQHCYEEFTCLARILPGSWTAEGCDPARITRPS